MKCKDYKILKSFSDETLLQVLFERNKPEHVPATILYPFNHMRAMIKTGYDDYVALITIDEDALKELNAKDDIIKRFSDKLDSCID